MFAHPDLQNTFGSSTLSALQNSYSLSISYAQAGNHQPLRGSYPLSCLPAAVKPNQSFRLRLAACFFSGFRWLPILSGSKCAERVRSVCCCGAFRI